MSLTQDTTHVFFRRRHSPIIGLNAPFTAFMWIPPSPHTRAFSSFFAKRKSPRPWRSTRRDTSICMSRGNSSSWKFWLKVRTARRENENTWSAPPPLAARRSSAAMRCRIFPAMSAPGFITLTQISSGSVSVPFAKHIFGQNSFANALSARRFVARPASTISCTSAAPASPSAATRLAFTAKQNS